MIPTLSARLFSIVLVMVSLISPRICFYEANRNVDDHLAEFSHTNETRNDNNADEHHDHKHMHKHSRDSEEHEHNHDHTRVAHVESKLFINTTSVFNGIQKIESEQSFHLTFLVSDPHPFDIFRPPIGA